MAFNLFALYAGPDQVMTVTSGLASIVGFLLIFWNKLVNLFLKLVGRAPELPEATEQDTTKTST